LLQQSRHVASKRGTISPEPDFKFTLTEPIISINASDARKYQHCGKGTTNGGSNENGSR